MAGVPGVLIALTISPVLALYTVGLFVFIQLAGVALATPLTAVLVSMLYVQDVLGDPVMTPGEITETK